MQQDGTSLDRKREHRGWKAEMIVEVIETRKCGSRLSHVVDTVGVISSLDAMKNQLSDGLGCPAVCGAGTTTR